MGFDKWLQRFVTNMEKIIFRTTLIFVVLLFIVQAMLLNGDLRTIFSKTDQLEGKPLGSTQDVFSRKVIEKEQAALSPRGKEEASLELALIPPPDIFPELFLLLNNEIVGSWQKNNNLRVNVRPGDLLEIAGEVPGGIPATIEVVEVYGNLKAPKKGYAIQTFGEREFLAWIIP